MKKLKMFVLGVLAICGIEFFTTSASANMGNYRRPVVFRQYREAQLRRNSFDHNYWRGRHRHWRHRHWW